MLRQFVALASLAGVVAGSKGYCNTWICGCPPHYDQPWCDPQNSHIYQPWCQQSSENCNVFCGTWCGAPTPSPPKPPHNISAYYLLAPGDNLCYQVSGCA